MLKFANLLHHILAIAWILAVALVGTTSLVAAEPRPNFILFLADDMAWDEHNWHDFDDHGRAVRTSRYKYIRNRYTDIPGTPPADAVRSPTFVAMRTLRDAGKLPPEQRGCFTVPRLAEELYDLVADPHELKNLAAESGHGEGLSQMRGLLRRWEQETQDRVPEARRPDEFDRETGEKLAR